MSGEASGHTKSIDSKGSRVETESSIKIQEGGSTSQDYVEWWMGYLPRQEGVLIFVASGGIPTRGQGSRHVGIFVGTNFLLSFQ
jgi:hypothetical protein